MKPNKFHPPCSRCGEQHSPFEPCEWMEIASRGSFRIIAIGLGIGWLVMAAVAIAYKLLTQQP